jgi:hypothetical protein
LGGQVVTIFHWYFFCAITAGAESTEAPTAAADPIPTFFRKSRRFMRTSFWFDEVK